MSGLCMINAGRHVCFACCFCALVLRCFVNRHSPCCGFTGQRQCLHAVVLIGALGLFCRDLVFLWCTHAQKYFCPDATAVLARRVSSQDCCVYCGMWWHHRLNGSACTLWPRRGGRFYSVAFHVCSGVRMPVLNCSLAGCLRKVRCPSFAGRQELQ